MYISAVSQTTPLNTEYSNNWVWPAKLYHTLNFFYGSGCMSNREQPHYKDGGSTVWRERARCFTISTWIYSAPSTASLRSLLKDTALITLSAVCPSLRSPSPSNPSSCFLIAFSASWSCWSLISYRHTEYSPRENSYRYTRYFCEYTDLKS